MSYQTYLNDCRTRNVAHLSQTEWNAEGKPETSEAYVKSVFARNNWPIMTERTVINDDGIEVKEPIKPKTDATKKTGKLRLSDLFKQGRIKAGDKLKIKGKPDSDATVIDDKQVTFYAGEKAIPMSWNEYTQRIVKHKAVNIYVWIEVGGKLLDTLRG